MVGIMYQNKNPDNLGIFCEIFIILIIFTEAITFFNETYAFPEYKYENMILLFFIILVLFILYLVIESSMLDDGIALAIDTVFLVLLIVITKEMFDKRKKLANAKSNTKDGAGCIRGK